MPWRPARRPHADPCRRPASSRSANEELRLDSLVAEADEEAVGFYRHIGFTVEAIETPWLTARFRCTLQRP